MFPITRTTVRIAIASSSVALLFCGEVRAQSLPVFDDAPSIEQLRSIMIPVTPPGTGRTIVIQRPDSSTSSVQRAAAPALSVPETAAAPETVAEPLPSAPVRQVAASGSATTEPKAVPPVELAAVAFHVNFAFGSADLPASARAMVERMATLMKEAPEMKIRVEGHTDAVGSTGYNMSLSQRRALSVTEYLVAQGVDTSRLLSVGKGMTEPLTPNRFDPANRRVQFVRIG